jgi:hypothetical protein
MIFKKSTLTKLLRATGEKNIRLHDTKLVPPVELRLDGNILKFTGYAPDATMNAILSRDPSGKALFETNILERGSYKNWKWNLKANSGYFAIAGAGDDYNVTTEVKASGAKAEVKKGEKTIAKASVESTGLYAWTYDLSAIWKNPFSFSETQQAKETLLHLWGSVRDEFGAFTLIAPKEYEEMDSVLN